MYGLNRNGTMNRNMGSLEMVIICTNIYNNVIVRISIVRVRV